MRLIRVYWGGIKMLFDFFKKRNKETVDYDNKQDTYEPKNVLDDYYEFSAEKETWVPKNREYLFDDPNVDYIIHKFDKGFVDYDCLLLYFNGFSCRDIVEDRWLYYKYSTNELICVTRHTDNGIENGTNISVMKKCIPNEVLLGNTIYDKIEYNDDLYNNLKRFIDVYFRIEVDHENMKELNDFLTKLQNIIKNKEIRGRINDTMKYLFEIHNDWEFSKFYYDELSDCFFEEKYHHEYLDTGTICDGFFQISDDKLWKRIVESNNKTAMVEFKKIRNNI